MQAVLLARAITRMAYPADPKHLLRSRGTLKDYIGRHGKMTTPHSSQNGTFWIQNTVVINNRSIKLSSHGKAPFPTRLEVKHLFVSVY